MNRIRLTRSPSLGDATIQTSASTLLGAITGFALDAVVLAIFGMTGTTDAYFVAMTVPLILITIMNMQASQVLQPMLIARREEGGAEAGWTFVNLMVASGAAVMMPVGIAGAAISHWLISLQAPGLPAPAAVLSERLSVCVFLILPLYYPIVVLRVALNSIGSFVLPGLMKFFENIFKIMCVLLLGWYLGAFALVLGLLCGALFQIGCFYGALRRHGYRARLHVDVRHPDCRRAYTLLSFPLVGHLSGAAVEVLNNSLASMLGPGIVTAFRLATRLTDTVAGLLANSIVIAAAPALTSAFARRDDVAGKKILKQSIKLLLLITVPVSVGLALLAEPFVALLYQRMSFTAADSQLVASVLWLMIPYIMLSRLLGLLELPFFAVGDTTRPFWGAIVQASSYVVLVLSLYPSFHVYGLPVARSLSYLTGSMFLFWLIRRRLGKMGLMSLRLPFLKILAASGAMAALIVSGRWAATALIAPGPLTKVTALVIPGLLGILGLTLVMQGLALVSVGPRGLTLHLDDEHGSAAG